MGAFRPSMPEVTRLKTFGRAREAQVDSVDDHGTASVPTWHGGVIAGATSTSATARLRLRERGRSQEIAIPVTQPAGADVALVTELS